MRFFTYLCMWRRPARGTVPMRGLWHIVDAEMPDSHGMVEYTRRLEPWEEKKYALRYDGEYEIGEAGA